MSDAEKPARSSEFGSTQGGQLFVGLCVAAISRCGSGSHADDVGLHAAFVIKQQRAAKSASLVIGMCSDAEKLAHR